MEEVDKLKKEVRSNEKELLQYIWKYDDQKEKHFGDKKCHHKTKIQTIEQNTKIDWMERKMELLTKQFSYQEERIKDLTEEA